MNRTVLRKAAWRFTRENVGHPLSRNGTLGENPAGLQCVNVPNDYWAALGLESWSDNAIDWIGRSDAYREWLPMGGWQRIHSGDVGVLHPGGDVSPFGHVVLLLDGTRLPPLCIEQDWPVGSVCQLGGHQRELYAGVVRVR